PNMRSKQKDKIGYCPQPQTLTVRETFVSKPSISIQFSVRPMEPREFQLFSSMLVVTIRFRGAYLGLGAIFYEAWRRSILTQLVCWWHILLLLGSWRSMVTPTKEIVHSRQPCCATSKHKGWKSEP